MNSPYSDADDRTVEHDDYEIEEQHDEDFIREKRYESIYPNFW